MTRTRALRFCSLVFLAVTLVPSAGAQVKVKAVGKELVEISIDGKPFTTLHIGADTPKPFLSPLRTGAGTVVTRRFPMEEVPGESHDHPHHRGLFIGYGSISGVNFWENERSYTTNNRGVITLESLDAVHGGKTSGTLEATFSWRGPTGTRMLREKRTMTFRGDGPNRIIDFDEILTAETHVEFADTKEGFFAIRLADSLREANGGAMTNSLGASGEKNVWGKRAEWVDYHGTADGLAVGITIFDHPGNPNHPPRWHSRAYGLFAVNPFGLKDFEPGSSEKGGLALAAGKQLRFRYRVLIHSGVLGRDALAAQYAAYSGGH